MSNKEKLIKNILKEVNIEKGKTFNQVGDFEVGQVWGREESFWLIKKYDKEKKIFEYIISQNGTSKLETTKSAKSLKDYFLLEPREKTYGEIKDKRIIEQLYIKDLNKSTTINPIIEKNTKELLKINDNKDNLVDLEKVLKSIEKDIEIEDSSTGEEELKKIFSKKAYTNGTNKIFLSFYNTEEIYEIKDLDIDKSMYKNFGLEGTNSFDNNFLKEVKESKIKEFKKEFKLDFKEVRLLGKRYIVKRLSDNTFLLYIRKGIHIQIRKSLLTKEFVKTNIRYIFKDNEKSSYIVTRYLLKLLIEYNNLELNENI